VQNMKRRKVLGPAECGYVSLIEPGSHAMIYIDLRLQISMQHVHVGTCTFCLSEAMSPPRYTPSPTLRLGTLSN